MRQEALNRRDYDDEAPPDPVQQFANRLWILHAFFIASIPIFVILGLFMVGRAETGSQDPYIPSARSLWLYGLFAFIALIDILLAFTVRGWFKPLADRQHDSAQSYANKRQTEILIMDALVSSIAVYGLAGFVLKMQPWQCFSLMGVALIFLLIFIGNIRTWVEDYGRKLKREAHPV